MSDPLHHGLLRKLSRDLAEEYERIQNELRGKPKNIQLSGQLAEAVWARLLREWLPPQYEFGFQRHLLYELPVDGEVRSPEIDMVLFHPAYPQRLRSENEVLVSGIVAAFSVKLTLTPSGLTEAIDVASQLRRGMKPRLGEPIGDLVSPLITGVLAQSHSEKFGKKPGEAIFNRLMDAGKKLVGPTEFDPENVFSADVMRSHPRNELDIACVADLGCWVRQPMVFWRDSPIAAHPDYDVYSASWFSQLQLEETPADVAEPIATLVADLWQKLANRDASLRPIADGFRMTGTSGSSQGTGNPQPLHPLIDPRTYPALRARAVTMFVDH